jgi:hypothetical protein
MYLLDALNGEILLGSQHFREMSGFNEDLLASPEKRPGPYEALTAVEKDLADALAKELYELRKRFGLEE